MAGFGGKRHSYMTIIKPKRGPTPKYDFNKAEFTVDASKLTSFKNLVYRHNKLNGTGYQFGYTFKPNTSKVTVTRLEDKIVKR